MGVLMFAVSARRNESLSALLQNDIVKPVGVVGAVREDLIRIETSDETAGGGHVILLARPNIEAEQQTEGVDYSVVFRAKTSAGAAKGLGFKSPPFTRPASRLGLCSDHGGVDC